MIKVPEIEALIKESIFTATRSSGKGGQNVNKVSTKVILLFNVLESNVLSHEQMKVFKRNLSSRISKDGIFRISSGRERTQFANRKRVIEKFKALVTEAFETDEERIATEPTAGSKLRRIAGKKILSDKKSDRTQRWDQGDEE